MQRERKPKNFLPQPVYKGGPKAMSVFIADQMNYPKEAIKNKIEGTVVLRITISYKGLVVGSQVKSGLGHGCDEEAKRIVNLLVFEGFRLPKAKKKTAAVPEAGTRLSYNIVSNQKANKPSYNYTITIGS